MDSVLHRQGWPSDPDHCDAIDTLLEMAGAEDRWGDQGRALVLLERVVQIIGPLPPAYERLRRRCERRDGAQALPSTRGVQFPHAVVAPTRRGGGWLSRR